MKVLRATFLTIFVDTPSKVPSMIPPTIGIILPKCIATFHQTWSAPKKTNQAIGFLSY